MMGAIRKSKGYSGDHRGQDQWKDTQRKKIADPDSAVLSDRQERGRPVTRLLYDSEKKIREVSQGKEVAGKEEE